MKLFNYLLLGGLFSISMSACTSIGCMDETAINYDANATEDNGECVYEMGCIDKTALNYDASAVKDDGSCKYDTIGKVNFWTDGKIRGSYINVTITKDDGTSNNNSDQPKNYVRVQKELQTSPTCSTTTDGKFEAGAGKYKYEASVYSQYSGNSGNETWEGTFTLNVGDCKSIQLDAYPNIKMSGRKISSSGGVDRNYLKVINTCNADFDITMVRGSALHMKVQPNATTTSTKMWDGKWDVWINKKSGEAGSGSCRGFYGELNDIDLSGGTLYEITIGQ